MYMQFLTFGDGRGMSAAKEIAANVSSYTKDESSTILVCTSLPMRRRCFMCLAVSREEFYREVEAFH